MKIFLLLFFLSTSLFASIPADELVLRIRHKPVNFDWNYAEASVDGVILKNTMEGLTQIGTKNELLSMLTFSHKVSNDGLVYTFYLKEKVMWSNGDEMTAQDFVASWKRLLSPVKKSRNASLIFDVEGARDYHLGKISDFSKVGIKAVKKYELKVTLAQRRDDFLWILTRWPTFPINSKTLSTKVTLGPFQLEKVREGNILKLKKYENYFGKSGNIKSVKVVVEKNDEKAIEKYKKGEYELLAKISNFNHQDLSDRDDFITYPSPRTFMLIFGTKTGITSKVQARSLLSSTINIFKGFGSYAGNYEEATSLVPKGIIGHVREIKPPLALDKSYLKGEKLTMLTLEYPDASQIASNLRRFLERKLGVKIRLHAVTQKGFRTIVLRNPNYNMYLYAPPVAYPHFDHFLSLLESQSGSNFSKWKNGYYDDLIKTARKGRNESEIFEPLLKAQKFALEKQAVAAPIFYDQNWALVNPKIQGFVPNQFSRYFLKYLSKSTD